MRLDSHTLDLSLLIANHGSIFDWLAALESHVLLGHHRHLSSNLDVYSFLAIVTHANGFFVGQFYQFCLVDAAGLANGCSALAAVVLSVEGVKLLFADEAVLYLCVHPDGSLGLPEWLQPKVEESTFACFHLVVMLLFAELSVFNLYYHLEVFHSVVGVL